MTPAEAWVRERLATAPAPLLEAILAALPPEGGPVPEALAAGAAALYARVAAGGCTHRRDALPLLAADALATHALEAQAEADPAGLASLAARMEAAIGAGAGAAPGA